MNFGQRTTALRGVDAVENEENERTSSRVYVVDAGVGIWRGLSARASFPLLDVSFTEGGKSGREFGIGDLSLWLRYGWSFGGARKPLRLGVSAGVFLPTGGTVQSDIPSNPNFVSGTVDPLLGLDATYNLEIGVGFFARVFTRLVAYDNDDGYRAGHSLVLMGGVHARIFDSLMPSIGVIALDRSRDTGPEGPVTDSGGDWVYVAPGLSYVFTGGVLAGLSLSVTVQIPVYQFLHGTQLGEDFNITLGVAYGFDAFGG